MSKLLVVDDEQSICWGLSRFGERMGHEVIAVSSAETALTTVERVRPDVVVLDVRLPGMDGLTAIERLRERVGDVPIIVITAYGDLSTAVEAIRNRAFEYIVKPFDLNGFQQVLERALRRGSGSAAPPTSEAGVRGLVGSSRAMQEVFKRIALAADSDAGVLLWGESGTGKELAARAIHQYSKRSGGPFVAVNVAALSPSLAESELFGHCRGAFTGADTDRPGLLAQAHGGTLFLDEVADIPLPLQVKLLRSLEQGCIVPVGSTREVPTDFRVISATHQDLPSMVRAGTFRHDLYFRLGSFRIEMPPLRERVEDIEELSQFFLSHAVAPKVEKPLLSDAALAELSRRPWYGNVRELRNALEHAAIVARGGVIEPDHLPPPAEALALDVGGQWRPDAQLSAAVRHWAEAKYDNHGEAGRLYEELLEIAEPALLDVAMDRSGGQYLAAARRLGLHRTTLRRKLDQYGLRSE